MRLIDADALVAQEEFFAKTCKGDFGEQIATHVIEVIKDAPTVEAIPVILCKDCALWDDADSEHLVGYCTEGDGEKITFRNEWCCWAERKEE